MNRSVTAGFLGLLLMSGTAFMVRAQNLPAVRTVILKAEVTATTGGGILTYNYHITNPAPNSGAISLVDIDISKPPGTVDLSGDGLINGPGFLESSSKLPLQEPKTVRTVPVGLSAPINWFVGLSLAGTAAWGATGDQDFVIRPGQTRSGYQVTSRGLPAIRTFTVQPDLDIDTLPIKPPEDETDLPRYKQDLAAIEASVSAKGVTVAPTAPPADFKPLAFLQTIQSYKDQALKQGWITSFGIANSLDAKLNSAQHALDRQDNTTAKNVLSALLHEVDAQGGKHLSPEAVALLKFNTEFLIARIP